MSKINIKLYQACIAKDLRLYEIANLAEIKQTRFSKILNGKLQPTVKEKQKLSKILRKPQKELF